jgi:hypothetical protein
MSVVRQSALNSQIASVKLYLPALVSASEVAATSAL